MNNDVQDPSWSEGDTLSMSKLKKMYQSSFNRLSANDERTIEFYYKMGETRGVDGYQYVSEAINRATMKKGLDKPISYVASLCKHYYKDGLYSQPSSEENDILSYIESKIGRISQGNKKLIQSAISTNGSVRTMAAASEVLNNSDLQDKIVEEIILGVVKIFGRPAQSRN